ncbi:MAG: CRISPR-associated RAMP protein Csx7 [Desulfatiglandales bacterium]
MFSTLNNRYIIKCKIFTEGPIAVSTGIPNIDTDAPVMRSPAHGNRPFVPGSSFRGALRSCCERILCSLGKYTCLLIKDPDCECPTINEKNAKEIREAIEKGTPEDEVLELVMRRLCWTCQLFGSPFLASKLKVSDLYASHELDCPVSIRHRVGIDRDTNTAAKGAKFDGETVEEGAFEMELILENAKKRDWGVLGLALYELKHGDFFVGGDQAVGAGRCVFEEDGLKIYYFDDDDKEGYGLVDFLCSDKAGIERYKPMEKPWEHIRESVESLLKP